MPYILTPRAQEQLRTLLADIAGYSGWSRSFRVEDSLLTAFEELATNPGIGHLRRDLVPDDVYFYFADPYMILYLRDTYPLSIIAIFHGARDIAALMADSPE